MPLSPFLVVNWNGRIEVKKKDGQCQALRHDQKYKRIKEVNVIKIDRGESLEREQEMLRLIFTAAWRKSRKRQS